MNLQEKARREALDEREARAKQEARDQEEKGAKRRSMLQVELDKLFDQETHPTFDGYGENTFATLGDFPNCRFYTHWANGWKVFVSIGGKPYENVWSLAHLGELLLGHDEALIADNMAEEHYAEPALPAKYATLTLGEANAETRPFRILAAAAEDENYHARLIVEYEDF